MDLADLAFVTLSLIGGILIGYAVGWRAGRSAGFAAGLTQDWDAIWPSDSAGA